MSKFWAKILAFSAITLVIIGGFVFGLFASKFSLALVVLLACVIIFVAMVNPGISAFGINFAAVGLTGATFASAILANAAGAVGYVFAASYATIAVGFAFVAVTMANKAINAHYARKRETEEGGGTGPF